MLIFVKTLSGQRITLEVESWVTVGSVRAKIPDHTSGDYQQKLVYEGQIMEDSNTLADYGILLDGSTISVIEKLSDWVTICVQAEDRAFSIEVERYKTISDFKCKIQDEEGIPSDQQQLIWRREGLEDGKILADCEGLYDESTISLIPLPSSGPITIYLYSSTRESVAFMVECSETIGNLKAKIQLVESIGFYPQRLIYAGLEMEDNKTLADYGCLHGCPVYVLGVDSVMLIIDHRGTSIPLLMESSDTIDNLKAEIQDLEGIPSAGQLLYVKGEWSKCERLWGDRVLADFGIQDGHIVRLCSEWGMIELQSATEREKYPRKKKALKFSQGLSKDNWTEDDDGTFLYLLVYHAQQHGKNAMALKKNVCMDIMEDFNAESMMNCSMDNLVELLNYYEHQYKIVNEIKNYPKFTWDKKRGIVVATDAEWKQYVLEHPEAKIYRTRHVRFFRELEILFSSEESQIQKILQAASSVPSKCIIC